VKLHWMPSRRAISGNRLSGTLWLGAGLALACGWSMPCPATAPAAGEAATPQLYAESVRTSQYVTVRDGTRLAIDIYRPAVGGKPIDTKLPVILVATPYHRSSENNNEILTFLAPRGTHRNIFAEILKHGYVIASLDLRGRGASFGTVYGSGMENEANRWDLYDVVEWLAVQPFSDGSIGMGGCSYVGKTQFLAASAAPPHLKAIAPTGAPFDSYGLARVNGVTRDLLAQLDRSMQALDVTYPAAPVDEDRDGALRKAAIAEHQATWNSGFAGFMAERAARPFRDSPWSRAEFSRSVAEEWNYLANYRLSKIPVFQYTGWRDLTLDHTFNWYEALKGAGVEQKFIIGPWYHCEWDQSDLTDAVAEYLQWYDYWLKGIGNGVHEGARIRYYTVGAPPGREWQSANQWPLPNETSRIYFLAAPASGGASLQTAKPGSGGKEDYPVDYTPTTAALPTRFFWGIPNFENPGLIPIKMTELDKKSLTYTTAPLLQDSEITGFPRLSLFVSSTATNQDFFVYLEDVDERGVSTLMTEGILRASNRAVRVAPFEDGGIPWHPNLRNDQVDLTPNVPVKLELALYPLSNFVRKGHRLRVAINNFDSGSGWDTPEIVPAPTVTLYHDAQHPSSITLPFITHTQATSR
jgi:putative CocE/NonD family hydrolase